MAFYDLNREERAQRVLNIQNELEKEISSGKLHDSLVYFGDEDTYIRKAAYLSIGRIYFSNKNIQSRIIKVLEKLINEKDFKIRQTVINAAGEIGKSDFESVQHFFDTGLFDVHHSPRNAVIGSIKKMGEVNPNPVLKWAKTYLLHDDKEIRREICHGIELRGRKHPQDILPLLKELQHDKTKRVRSTLVHVIGQIAYKKGCLEIVLANLKSWSNKELVAAALDEIIDVHQRYKNFSAMTQKEAIAYIEKNYP
ncbi:hypothetical protein CNR22_04825 [Sphingobacteriaceae bacterium]|nr:hypothetical protein CNR22_04825 [Sphingobacteriaceae bacterium]